MTAKEEVEVEKIEESVSINKTPCQRIIVETDPRFGLIENIEYSLDENGFIDWKAMLPQKYLFINEQKLKELGKDAPESIDEIEDSMKMVKLGGIKWLARIRGYEGVSFTLLENAPNAVVKCKIDWVPNIENPLGASYEEIASCGPSNSDSFSKKYLEVIASNRAFARCVRNFLNIDIVSEEEVATDNTPSQSSSNSGSVSVDPQSIFINICKEKGMSLDEIVQFCISQDESLSTLDGLDESHVIKTLTPKQAKSLLRSLKKMKKSPPKSV